MRSIDISASYQHIVFNNQKEMYPGFQACKFNSAVKKCFIVIKNAHLS